MRFWLPDHAGYLLHERATEFAAHGTGWFSFKWFPVGTAWYQVGTCHYRLEQQQVLLLNNGQSYSITIDAQDPVESCCLFCAPSLVASAAAAAQQTLAQMLDGPPDPPPPEVYQQVYHNDPLVGPALARLRSAGGQGDANGLLEQVHVVLARFFRLRAHVDADIARLSAARPATRAEAYRRACIVRDYLDAHSTQPVRLQALAALVHVSPNQLLRLFSEVMHTSPHQYLIVRRIQQAQRLLRETEQSVTDICFAVGFSSLGSFSTLFHRRVGVSPTHYRQQMR